MVHHPVKKLPRDPGPAAWNALLPKRTPTPALDADITVDWLIIGAGWAGLAAARRLSQLRGGDRIAVLEAREVGEGPAGRNSGFMTDLPHHLSADSYVGGIEKDLEETAMNRAAIDYCQDAAQEYGLDDEAFCRPGKLYGAATDKGAATNRAHADHLMHLGEPIELIDAAGMQAITGTDFYISGLQTQGAAMVQPAMFVRGVADGLKDKVSIYENSPVTDLSRIEKDWVATTPQGKVTAPTVILAVNGHAQSFGFFDQKLMHVFTYASMTRGMAEAEITALGGVSRWGILPADPMGTTVRRISGTGGDRIVIRNRFTYDPSMEVSDRRIKSVGRDHDKAFAARFPMLGGLDMEYRWGGRLCLSWNTVPCFGEVEDRLFSACCQNGLGTSKGTLAGMAAAEDATRSNSPLIQKMQAYDPPKTLPPEPFAWLGANATMRWKEFRAGKEL